MKAIKLFQSLEFVIHPEKSKFIPSKKVEYLGFVIDSERMVTYLSDHKKKKIYDKCQSISKKQDLKIRDVASFIGTLTSTFPANEYGPFYYRAISKNEGDFLKANKGNFNARIDLTKNALQEIKWWEKNIFYAFKRISKVKISKVIYTDAPLEGCGACYGNTPTSGAWLPDEKRLHINFLELRAIFLDLKVFIKTKTEHVKIMCDNTRAISLINKMGTSHSMECHYLNVRIWEWAMKSNIQLAAAHIPEKQNIIADRESRVCHVHSKWMLSRRHLISILKFNVF